jgi:ankyrin repeat protein
VGVVVGRNPNDRWTSDVLQKGDLQAVRDRALSDTEYLTSRDYLGDTPLATAIHFDSLELVEFLLGQGADPNAAVDDGYTCLLSAVESDSPTSIAIVKALIEGGANIHQTGTNGWTPLHMAAAHGYLEKAKLLIQAGARVNEVTEIDGGNTPLMEAAHNGKPETVQLLLDRGADPSVRNGITNRTALETAQYVAAGPDQDVYDYLKERNMQIDMEAMFDGLEMSVEDLAATKELMANVHMADNYVESCKRIVESGNHAEVIRILSKHAALP